MKQPIQSYLSLSRFKLLRDAIFEYLTNPIIILKTPINNNIMYFLVCIMFLEKKGLN